jgi:hypothetical protein
MKIKQQQYIIGDAKIRDIVSNIQNCNIEDLVTLLNNLSLNNMPLDEPVIYF